MMVIFPHIHKHLSSNALFVPHFTASTLNLSNQESSQYATVGLDLPYYCKNPSNVRKYEV